MMTEVAGKRQFRHTIVFLTPFRHLERVLRSFSCHYNGHRPHQGIGQRVPGAMPTPFHRSEPAEVDGRQISGPVRRRDRLDGLIHEYERAA
jgi:putative transposase